MTIIDKVALLHLVDGRILSTRSRGKDTYYLPGGKRDGGETDVQTLVREVWEELAVRVAPESAERVGVFEAQAHGHAAGVVVRMTCYRAQFVGVPVASSEIEEVAWLGYADRGRVSAVDQVVFDYLYRAGTLR